VRPHRRRRRLRRDELAWFVVSLVVPFAVIACGTDTSPDDPPPGALVPDDERFAASFRVDRVGDTANLSWQTNASAEFDPDIDPDLYATGFQIDDRAAWPGAVDGVTDRQREALRAVLDDAANHERVELCEAISDDPLVVSCTYDVGQPDAMPVLVRRVGESVLLAFGTDAALDVLDGDFTETP
jgi:hypothetical protein